MKYVNPEYVSIVAMSNDVIAASLDITYKAADETTPYSQEVRTWYTDKETATYEKKETTIYLGLDKLGI